MVDWTNQLMNHISRALKQPLMGLYTSVTECRLSNIQQQWINLN